MIFCAVTSVFAVSFLLLKTATAHCSFHQGTLFAFLFFCLVLGIESLLAPKIASINVSLHLFISSSFSMDMPLCLRIVLKWSQSALSNFHFGVCVY